MALQHLIARLEQEARCRVDAIQRNADREVEAIRVAAEQEADEIISQQLGRKREVRQEEQRRELVAARRQARSHELQVRHAQIARVLQRARTAIADALESSEYVRTLPSHVDEAMAFLAGIKTQVRCTPRLADVVRPALARYTDAVLVVDESVEPGIVAAALDGSVTIDNTVAARLARAESRLAVELSRKLNDACH